MGDPIQYYMLWVNYASVFTKSSQCDHSHFRVPIFTGNETQDPSMLSRRTARTIINAADHIRSTLGLFRFNSSNVRASGLLVLTSESVNLRPFE